MCACVDDDDEVEDVVASTLGCRQCGRLLGKGILLRRSTTRCMAAVNSDRLSAPSRVTSHSCQMWRSSSTGMRLFSKKMLQGEEHR